MNTSLEDPENYRLEICQVDSYELADLMTRLDFETFLPDDILVKVDRASMLNSLEIRAPLLDHRIIEFVFGQIPGMFKLTAKEGKIFLRILAQKLLPKELDLNRKQGFSPPLSIWLKGKLSGYIESVLREADDKLFNQSAIQKLLEAQRRGLSATRPLFALMMFELWRRHYSVSI